MISAYNGVAATRLYAVFSVSAFSKSCLCQFSGAHPQQMPTGFDPAFRRVKELVADFPANEKFYLSPAYQEQEARRNF
ncbi:MAG TPA: hypothetical protein VF430_02575, partial [Verrucomicrobiae bacterium]